MKNKIIGLAALLTLSATPAISLDQEELQAAFSLPNAPKAEMVEGVSQKGDDILVLEYESETPLIKSFNGLDWSPLEISLVGDETGIATVPSKNGYLNPSDLITVTETGEVDVYRANENGIYNIAGTLGMIKPDSLYLEGISFNGKNLEVLAKNNKLYQATIDDNSNIVIDMASEKQIGDLDELVGYTRISKTKTGELTNNTFTQRKFDGKETQVDAYTANLQDGQSINPIPYFGECGPSLESGLENCGDYACTPDSTIPVPIYRCL